MTRAELDRLLEAARHDSDNVEFAASKIAEALNLVGESDLTAQEMKEAAIKLVWTATSSDWIRLMLINAIFGEPIRRPGNPGKPEKREWAISIDAYRKHFGDEPASVRRMAKHISVSRPTISEWRKDPIYQKEVSDAARDYKDTIEIIGIRPAKIKVAGILRRKKTNVK